MSKVSKTIKRTAVYCFHCRATIISIGVRDYVTCNCNNSERVKKSEGLFVDGGGDYIRMGTQVGWREGKDYVLFNAELTPNSVEKDKVKK